jgi:hypothetical protein
LWILGLVGRAFDPNNLLQVMRRTFATTGIDRQRPFRALALFLVCALAGGLDFICTSISASIAPSTLGQEEEETKDLANTKSSVPARVACLRQEGAGRPTSKLPAHSSFRTPSEFRPIQAARTCLTGAGIFQHC